VARANLWSVYSRKKRNKSGTTSIHIVRKEGSRQVHVKAVGSAQSEEQLALLELLAQEQIAQLKQQSTLDLKFDEDKKHIELLRNSIDSVQIAGVELILGKLFNEIGFNAIAEPLFRHLVLCRICYPGSKLRTVDYLQRHHNEVYDIDHVYRYLDKINIDYKDQLQTISYEHTAKLFEKKISVVFYDVTTLYFEAEQEDELRRLGFSKDGKHHNPQIVLGLLVSINGYPLAFEMFEGNKFEGETMLTVVESFKKKFQLSDVVVVADAGLMSKQNIDQLIALQYQFILGARLKNESEAIKKQVLSLNLENGQTYTIEKPDGLRIIISYSRNRAANDLGNRSKGLKRLENALKKGKLTKQHINNRGYNKYLTLTGDIQIQIDYQKFEDDKKWDGLKGYITNTTIMADEVIKNYQHLWHIEKAFRISKTDLRIRPIYHHLKRRIQSHLIIAFCAYKVYKELERQLAMCNAAISATKAIEIMLSIFAVKTQLPQSRKQATIILARTEEQKHLLNCFDIQF
jgi:transposase